MDRTVELWRWGIGLLGCAGEYVGLLSLRLLLGWEYWESGVTKLRGENWFTHIQGDFPFPFNMMPAAVNWHMATWAEIVGAMAIVIGLGTRAFSGILIILTLVAAYAVHFPEQWTGLADFLKGYAITDKGYGNYKLAALFTAMLLPLVFLGPGRLSVDALISRWLSPAHRTR